MSMIKDNMIQELEFLYCNLFLDLLRDDDLFILINTPEIGLVDVYFNNLNK